MDFRAVHEVCNVFYVFKDEVLSGQRHASAVCGRSNVHDDGAVFHCDEGKVIVSSCTEAVKKSDCFTMTMSRSVSEYQESQCTKVE